MTNTKQDNQPENFPAPDGLSDRSAAIWHTVVPSRARSPERLLLVETALFALDRAAEARVAIANDGIMATTKRSGVAHLNPAVKVERESAALFAKIWGQLAMQFNTSIDGRMDFKS
jgi:hypothetical protein